MLSYLLLRNAESGKVFVCGEAESGKLGIAVDFRTQVAPKQMQLSGPAALVACGGHHTLILGGKWSALNFTIYVSVDH